MFSNPHYPRRRSTLTPTPGTPRRKTEVNIQHRLVYEVFPEEHTILVLRMWTHYE